MGGDPDILLLKQVVAGNKKAFGTLIDRHQEFVFTIAFRILKNREDAEEITQDVFLKIYEVLPQFKMESKFTTWIYTITYRAAISKLRKLKKEPGGPLEVENAFSLDSNTANPLEKLEEKDRIICIKRGIEHLGSNEAIVLTLHYLKELKIREIADITGISEANIKVHLHRGRKNLFQSMQQQNYIQ